MVHLAEKAKSFVNQEKKQRKMTEMIRNVIFDVGYVLIGYSWKEQFLRFGFSQEDIRTMVCGNPARLLGLPA